MGKPQPPLGLGFSCVSAGGALSVYLWGLLQRSRLPHVLRTPYFLSHPPVFCLDVHLILSLKTSNQITDLLLLDWVEGRLVGRGWGGGRGAGGSFVLPERHLLPLVTAFSLMSFFQIFFSYSLDYLCICYIGSKSLYMETGGSCL